jgi:hypothetical protein
VGSVLKLTIVVTVWFVLAKVKLVVLQPYAQVVALTESHDGLLSASEQVGV